MDAGTTFDQLEPNDSQCRHQRQQRYRNGLSGIHCTRASGRPLTLSVLCDRPRVPLMTSETVVPVDPKSAAQPGKRLKNQRQEILNFLKKKKHHQEAGVEIDPIHFPVGGPVNNHVSVTHPCPYPIWSTPPVAPICDTFNVLFVG